MADRSGSPAIVWFRKDLRLADNPALLAARTGGRPVIPVFIWSPSEEGNWPPGAASRWWLHHSLESLDTDLHNLGSRLLLLPGPAPAALCSLAGKTGAGALFWNRRYEPAAILQEEAVMDTFDAVPAGPASVAQGKKDRPLPRRLVSCRGRTGILIQSFNAALLREPWEVSNRSGGPFRVFTPYWKSCLSLGEPAAPLVAPRKLVAPGRMPSGLRLRQLDLLPRPDWAGGLAAEWTPGRKGASQHLRRFLKAAMAGYERRRDRPDEAGTSRLSPHLHHGEIGVREVWATARRHATVHGRPGDTSGSEEFLRQIGWREFAHHILFHFPHTPERPLREEFRSFPWRRDPGALAAWQKGRTGFPLVDAAMRELWSTGWMHNRVRMVAASFLVKDLLLPWHEGARWFWDTLVDADLANNTLGWQWTAGCGADAAPYFRIFNPANQGTKHDPHGSYTRRWVPELAELPDRWIHQPHDAPASVLATASADPGGDYPRHLVEHGAARQRALAAFASITKRRYR